MSVKQNVIDIVNGRTPQQAQALVPVAEHQAVVEVPAGLKRGELSYILANPKAKPFIRFGLAKTGLNGTQIAPRDLCGDVLDLDKAQEYLNTTGLQLPPSIVL